MLEESQTDNPLPMPWPRMVLSEAKGIDCICFKAKDNAGYNVSQRIMLVTMFHKG